MRGLRLYFLAVFSFKNNLCGPFFLQCALKSTTTSLTMPTASNADANFRYVTRGKKGKRLRNFLQKAKNKSLYFFCLLIWWMQILPRICLKLPKLQIHERFYLENSIKDILVLSMSFYPDFDLISSRFLRNSFYPNFVQILSRLR